MEPVLDITTVFVRPSIRVDGVVYELFAKDELPVVVHMRMKTCGQRLEQLEKIKRPNKDQNARYLKELRAFVALTTDTMPRAVIARLRESHCRSIIRAFFQRPLATAPAPAGNKRKKSPTGAK